MEIEKITRYLELASIHDLIQSLIMTFILIAIIFFTYKRVYRSDDYKAKFNLCLSVIILITTMIISVIKTNLNISLGLLGILSIVRFRVKLNDFRDVGFILWGIGAGIAIATDHYLIGFTYTVVISLYFIFMNDKLRKSSSVNTLIIRGTNLEEKKIEEVLKKNCSSYKKLALEEKENYTEIIYDIECKKQEKLKEKLTSKVDIKFIKFV